MSSPFTEEELELIEERLGWELIRDFDNPKPTESKTKDDMISEDPNNFMLFIPEEVRIRQNILRKIRFQLETKKNKETDKPDKVNPLSWMDKK